VVASLSQFNHSTASIALLVAFLGRNLLELLLVLVLLADMVLRALMEQCPTTSAGQRTAGVVLAHGVGNAGLLIGNVRRWG
jgi:hypothetical protein